MLTFNEPIFYGRFLRRYQRFFMDVLLDDGSEITAHTPNTGSMMGLLKDNSRVLLTKSGDPKRAYPYTTQAIEADASWVGINTHAPNKLIKASFLHPLLQALQGYRLIKPEQRYGHELRSRVDFYCADSTSLEPPLYLEIKSVTLKINDDAQFPDAVSSRALKHVADLVAMIDQGSKAALWFIVQRQDCQNFRPAAHIDRQYAEALTRARGAGLQVRALAARIDEQGLRLTHELPCIIE